MSAELWKRGIRHGDRVLFWGDDSPEWVVSFFASVCRGAVVVPLDRTSSGEFVRRVAEHTGARLCLCSAAQQAMAPSCATMLFDSVAELPEPNPDIPIISPESKPGDAVEIVFTSGTTADPKGVVLTHENILANIQPLEREIARYRRYERLVHPLRFLNLVPLSHVFGQLLGVFIPQILGATVVFPASLAPADIIRTARKERVSVLVAVPRMLDSLRNRLEDDLSTEGLSGDLKRSLERHFIWRWWRFRKIHRRFGFKFWAVISGGASLSAETEQFWRSLGFVVIQGYGMTETGSLISVNHPFRTGKGSIGKVLPGREMKLAPDGEILVRGRGVAQHYYRDRAMTPLAEGEGWFHTGDLGTVDEQGNLYFRGRRKNVIVGPEGLNIFPEDLEAALRRQPEIRDCLVFGLDRGGNTEPCAALILRDDADEEAAIRRANMSLAEYQRIRRWFIWPEKDFPRGTTQKPLVRVVREYAEKKFSEGGSQERGGMVAELIARITGRAVDGPADMSSLERVELLGALEERFQVDLDESVFTQADTVSDLENVISRPVSQQSSFSYPVWPQSGPMRVARILLYYIFAWPATLLAFPRVKGRENLRNQRGPLLFAANHITHADIGFILAALPLRFRHRLAIATRGEALEELRNPSPETPPGARLVRRCAYWLALVFFNLFPLPQKSGFRESFAFAGESVDRGYSLLVFPEGVRARDGRTGPFRAGVGILASNLRIPVVPVRIDGLHELKRAGRKWALPGSVTVSIGQPKMYGAETDPESIARDLEARVAGLHLRRVDEV